MRLLALTFGAIFTAAVALPGVAILTHAAQVIGAL